MTYCMLITINLVNLSPFLLYTVVQKSSMLRNWCTCKNSLTIADWRVGCQKSSKSTSLLWGIEHEIHLYNLTKNIISSKLGLEKKVQFLIQKKLIKEEALNCFSEAIKHQSILTLQDTTCHHKKLITWERSFITLPHQLPAPEGSPT